jgi:site-specific recombinase XerD
MLNKMSVSELAKLSNLSKSYISQVQHGKCPPSQNLLDALAQRIQPKRAHTDYLALFLQSRQSMNVSSNTLTLYRFILARFLSHTDAGKVTTQDIEQYLVNIPAKGMSLGNRHAHFRTLKTFFRWLESSYGILSPMGNMKAPKLPKMILPSLTKDELVILISKAGSIRNQAIIAFAVESGLRVSELAQIKGEDIDWQNRIVKVLCKGRKEAYAPFGDLSERYLREWLTQYVPNGNIWGIDKLGIKTMLRRLQCETGLPCNAHTFRRTFACLLRKAGVDTMTIKDLGRWESLEMVQRYTRSISFQDSLRFYKAPLGEV